MKSSLIISMLLLAFFAKSQEAEFKKVVEELKANLTEVKTGDKSYEHSLELLHTSVIKYKVVEVDGKGNRKASIYEFNISDLDPYLVREETRKDIIYLNMTIDNGQKFIKEYLNEEVKGYESSISMVTSSIDNARKLKELFKEAIPLAKQIMEKKLSITTYEAMESWLEESIAKAEGSSKSYDQRLIPNSEFPGSFRLLQTTITSKSSTERQYDFNLADINISSLRFNIVGSSLSLDFETKRKQNIIRMSEKGEPKGFENEIEIFTNNVEEARDLKSVLTMVVPLAEEKVKDAISAPESSSAAIEYLSGHVKKVGYGEKVIEQKVTGDCLLTYASIESSPKSSEAHRYVFNLMDIDQNLVDIDVSSNRMFVKTATKKSVDLIKDYENNEFDRYTDEFRLYAADIEVARRIKAALESAIGLCEASYTDPFENMSTAQRIDWLEQNLGEVRVNDETITQKFERTDESNLDKFKLTKVTVDAKGGTEEIFEFNFTDINPKSIQYDIRGKSLSVSFETKFSEEIIKHYKDGEIENYQDSFELNLGDIEKARQVINAFNLIIADLND